MALTQTQLQEVESIMSIAVKLHQQGDLQQAESLYRRVIEINPRHADAFNLLGVIANQVNEPDASCKLIRRAIRINPEVAQYHFNLGVTYQSMGDHIKSASSYQHCIRLDARYPGAYENLSIAYRDSDNPDAAYDLCKKGLRINKNSLILNQNMGALLFTRGEYGNALKYLNRVLDMAPAYADAHLGKAAILLLQGDYRKGWEEYEWRYFSREHTRTNTPRVVPFPKWDGSSLAGKSILVTAEQGVGDEILFSSCFPDLLSKAKKCVIECDRRLIHLFSRSYPQGEFIAKSNEDFIWNKGIPLFDYRISSASLPYFFRRNRDDFPLQAANLRVNERVAEKWRKRLSQLDKSINVGISWEGGRIKKSKAARSVPLDLWKDLLGNRNVNFINLQYGDHHKQIQSFNKRHNLHLYDLDGVDPIADLDNFCALISELDLVISIDNSTVHLAGAVGTPTWALLPCSPAWVWQQKREDSDWYRSVRLFRQQRFANSGWQDLMGSVNEELGRYLIHTKSPSGKRTAINTNNEATDDSVLVASHKSAQSALLLNDTSAWYHWGCSCTTLAIHARLREQWDSVSTLPIQQVGNLAKLPDSIEAFDDDDIFKSFCSQYPGIIKHLDLANTIFVNGEGSLHGTGATAIGLLYLSYIAKCRFNKEVRVINHSCYPEDKSTVSDSLAFQLYRKVYSVLDSISVRETISHRLVSEMGIPCRQAFDCLPLYIERYFTGISSTSADTITIAGSVAWDNMTIGAIGEVITRLCHDGLRVRLLIGANAYLAEDDIRLSELLRKQCGRAFELYYSTSESDWLECIAASTLLISGRFHHSIAAGFLDTPFLVLESNTPKIDGFVEMFSLDTRVTLNNPEFGDRLYAKARDLIANPGQYLLTEEKKRHLIELSEQNFSL